MSELVAGTGSSTHDDARTAGAQAARQAMDAIPSGRADLVVVWTSVRYDASELVRSVREITGSATLVGATSAGHFAAGTSAPAGTGVRVLALAGGPYRFGVASASGVAAEPAGTGELATERARDAAAADDDATRPHAALLLLTNGLTNDNEQVLNGAYRVCGAAVPVVGGAAGDDRQMTRTLVFHDDEVLDDAAVAVWITSPHPLQVGAAHGWTPISPPQLITRAESLVVHEIGGRPAVQVWEEMAVVPEDRRLLRADGQEFKATFALGVIEPDGTHSLRGVYSDGAVLRSFAAVHEYSAVQVVTGHPQAVMSVVEPLVSTAVASVPRAGVVLAFDCIARADLLADRVHEEAESMQRAAGEAVTFGFYTYGEFGRRGGVGGVHNGTLCVLAL